MIFAMDEKRMNKIIAEHLPSAYLDSPDCPAPEIWAAVVNRDLAPAECDRLDQHAVSCRACSAERQLAVRFLEDLEESDEDVAWLVNKMKSATEERSNVVSFPLRSKRLLQPLLGLAAAAMLVLAFAPMLPSMLGTSGPPAADGTVRGSTVSIVAPEGDLDYFPGRLEWRAVREAGRYQLSLITAAGDLVWRSQTRYDNIEIPSELIEPYTVYNWQVEALDDDGRTLASSRLHRFRVIQRKP